MTDELHGAGADRAAAAPPQGGPAGGRRDGDDRLAEARAAVIARARSADGPLLLDFDGTLLPSNSTESFLDAARPRVLVAALLILLDKARPWRLLPARRDRRRAWRDVLRLAVATTIDRSLRRRWRETEGPRLAAALEPELLRLAGAPDAVVLTLGFEEIVRPILAAAGGGCRVVAMPWLDWRARDAGKLALLGRAMDDLSIARAVLVTDDPAGDADVAGVAALTLRWPLAGPMGAAFDDVRLPFRRTGRRGRAASRRRGA